MLRTKIASLFSLPSCNLFLCSSDNDPLPCPPPREGACGGWSGPLSCSDITSSCKTQVLAGTATFHLCSSDCYPPQPSLIREVARKKLLKHRCQSDILKPLKQVQDDLFNLLKSTYSPIHLFTYSLRKKAAFTLAEGATHVAHFDKIRRAAFTLAEVLITLGIIGVVAAMTIPVLIANKRAKELETGLKKSASVIQQAILMANQENGVDITPANCPATSLKNTLKPYFNVLKDCGMGVEFGSCVANTSYDTNKDAKNIYKNYSKTQNVNYTYLDDGQLLLMDGSLILIENPDPKYGHLYISVDVNGYNKAPNAWGHDLFTFELTSSGKFLPMGAKGTMYEGDTYCSNTSTDEKNGISCTYKALSEPDYFKKLP